MGIRCTEEEVGGVLRPGVEVREYLMSQLGQPLVLLVVRDLRGEHDAVELRPWSLSALGLHVVAAVVNCQRYVREGLTYMFWCDPFGGIVRVVVVTVLAQTVGGQEVYGVAVAVLKPGNHIIPGNCSLQRLLAGDLLLIRIDAVAFDAGHVGAEQAESAIAGGTHVATSSQSVVK